ncbi:MAG: rod shape-determining protein RodA [Aquificae bacterium]|nr:rod shape-determining protein RodA [Aquificota bacterium]
MRFPGALYNLDYFLLLVLLGIQLFGLAAVYSATYAGGPSALFYKQLVYAALSWVVILLLSREKFENLLDLSLYLYLFNLFLLMLVLLYGKEVYGAKRWLGLGFVNLQPSEFMKFSLVLVTAHVLPAVKGIKDRNAFLLFLLYAMPAALTLKQPDLGTTVAYFVPLTFMLLARGVRLRYFILAALLAAALSPLVWSYGLKEYQKKRILAVLDPYSDYYGSGYQLIQSKIAVGSGGLWGKGFLEGTQTHLMFLPEKHTDFIFAVIAEELGFIGSFSLSVLFFLFALRLVFYYRKFRRLSEKVLVAGVLGLVLFQFTVNTLMTMGLFPVVGIPLPFVSLGGSSMLSFALLVGTLQSVYGRYKDPYLRMEGEPRYREV